jgi:predicted DsbA family dithiol-disulfide isomerase
LLERFDAAGLAYNPHPDVVPNSRNALRLTELARDRGKHEQVHNRLMDAYWAEGRNIGDSDVLRELLVEVGLDAEQVEGVLANDRYLDRVEGSTRQAVSLGITGIPACVLDRRLIVLGAQPSDVFEQAFAQLTT